MFVGIRSDSPCHVAPPGTNPVRRAFLQHPQEEQLLNKLKYMDVIAIALVILFAGIPTVVALAT
jgi:hypothetical protein